MALARRRLTAFAALLLGTASMASARDGALDLRYRFSSGQTNVYNIAIQVRGETGLEVISGNVFIVTSEVGSNVFRLGYRASLDNRRTQEGPARGGFMPPMYSGRVNVPPMDRSDLRMDDRGQVLLDADDYPLPIPFGTLMTALIEPLPPSPTSKKWETSGSAGVMDYPYAVGPAMSFSSQQFGPPYFMSFGPRSSAGVVTVSEHATYHVTDITPEAVTIRKELTLRSLLNNGSDPRCSASAEGTLVFDPVVGMLRKINLEGRSQASTETASRDARVSLTCRLLEGEELLAALVPSVAVSQSPPPAAEMPKIMADLGSDDITVRRMAANRLANVTLDSPSPELLKIMTGLVTDADMSIRQPAASFLKNNATTNEVPVLIKLLGSSDFLIQQNVIKALTRLKDERAIQPLADDIERGAQPGQQEAATALIAIGPAAEPAVLSMLQERSLETRRQACRILQQIGSTNSLAALKENLADPDQMLSQSAAEAIRMINMRQ